MVKNIYKKLEKWDSTLLNAHRLNFVHLTNTEFIELKQIYEEYKNKEVTKSQLNCNTCRVKIVKELAKDYLEQKEKDLKKVKNKKDVDKQTEPKIIND